MVFVEGFSLGNAAGFAFFQSTYTVESWLSQNARSSASVLNSGVFLVLVISGPLFPVHVTSRNNAYQAAGFAQGESDMEASIIVCAAQGMIPMNEEFQWELGYLYTDKKYKGKKIAS